MGLICQPSGLNRAATGAAVVRDGTCHTQQVPHALDVTVSAEIRNQPAGRRIQLRIESLIA